jgi:micrococcal nuclease
VRAAVLTLALLAIGCGAQSPCGPSQGKVVNVVDGDTVDLETGVRIRLLLIDTPETTGGKTDCYGQQAKAFTASFLDGKNVNLQYDTQCTDRFGRTLAYVSVDGKEINSTLVKDGYACVLYVAPDGMARRTEFEDLESVAKTNRTGLWGACTTVTCG